MTAFQFQTIACIHNLGKAKTMLVTNILDLWQGFIFHLGKLIARWLHKDFNICFNMQYTVSMQFFLVILYVTGATKPFDWLYRGYHLSCCLSPCTHPLHLSFSPPTTHSLALPLSLSHHRTNIRRTAESDSKTEWGWTSAAKERLHSIQAIRLKIPCIINWITLK